MNTPTTQHAPLDPVRAKALDAAVASTIPATSNDHSKVVERAIAYHGFLTGAGHAKVSAPAGATGAASATATKPPAATGATGAATSGVGGGRPPAATGGAAKPPAATTGAAKSATATTGAAKSATATTGAAKSATATTGGGKPAAATGAPKTTTTKAPAATDKPKATGGGAQPTMNDVTLALQAVFARAGGGKGQGKEIAYGLLKEAGSGATSAKDLKPTLYATVIAACNNWKPEPVGEAQPDFAETEGEPVVVPDTSGAASPAPPISSDDDALDSDPPEQTAGGAGAEDM